MKSKALFMQLGMSARQIQYRAPMKIIKLVLFLALKKSRSTKVILAYLRNFRTWW